MTDDTDFAGRQPTSHERTTGRTWDASYHDDDPAPWDIGHPQPAIVRLAAEGRFVGPVLDAGCGTGENGLHVAAQGLQVLGFDVAETAVKLARQKADDQGLDAEFTTADALQLAQLGRRFATVVDCGLFHTFDGDEQSAYAASLASVTDEGGTVFVLCFSDQGPDTGPHPVTRADVDAAFAADRGWKVVAIDPDRVQTRFHGDAGAPAWLATIRRT